MKNIEDRMIVINTEQPEDQHYRRINTKKISCFCTDGKISVRINLPLFSTVVPAFIFIFLSCRPFVAITTLATGLVGVEVTSVSWLGQLTVGVGPVDNVVIATKGLQDRKINIIAWTTVENKGKLIIEEVQIIRDPKSANILIEVLDLESMQG